MKKIVSALLCMMLAVQLCVPVFASDVPAENPADGQIGLEEIEVIDGGFGGGVANAPLAMDESMGAANGDAASAVAIAVNTPIAVTTQRIYDDWFVFTAQASGTVSLNINQTLGVANGQYQVRMYKKAEYDAQGRAAKMYIAQQYASNTGSVIQTAEYGVAANQQYYIRINHNFRDTAGYTLTVNNTANAAWDTNEGTINPLKLGQTYQGSLKYDGRGDVKYYSFKAAKTGYISVNFKNSAGAANAAWDYALFTSKPNANLDNYYDIYTFLLNKTSHQPARLGVKKGQKLWIAVAGRGYMVGGTTYSLKVTNKAAKNWEIDNQNSVPKGAMAVKMGQKAYGSFGNITTLNRSKVYVGGASRDWYKITVPSSGSYRLVFANDKTAEGNVRMSVIKSLSVATKMNKYRTNVRTTRSIVPINNKILKARGTTTVRANLSAGTYYIALWRVNSGTPTAGNQSYSFSWRR